MAYGNERVNIRFKHYIYISLRCIYVGLMFLHFKDRL
jgi:hypothetical protein